MQRSPRGGASIDRLYLHKNEGPEVEGGAIGLFGFLQRIDGGYHVIVDDHSTVRAANDDEVVWGEGGDNEHALALCDIGWSAETAAQYATDPYSIAEFERTAVQFATWCLAYNVPPVHCAPGAPGQAPTGRGLCEHADDHDPSSQGHTDPGVGYPMPALSNRVTAIIFEILKPQPAPLPPNYDVWVQAVNHRPLHLGDRGPNVRILNSLLVQHHFLRTGGDAFSYDTAHAMGSVIKTWLMPDKDTHTCDGHDAWALANR